MVHYVPLPVPEKANHKGAVEHPNTEIFTLTEQCVQRMLAQESVQDNIHDVLLMALGTEVLEDFPKQSAFQLPIGMSQLICLSRWKTLAVPPNSRWDRDSDIYDLLLRIRRISKSFPGGNELVSFTLQQAGQTETLAAPSMYVQLAQDLMAWTDSICASADSADETRDSIHRYVLFLNSTHAAHSADMFVSHAWEGGGNSGKHYNRELQSFGQYRAAFLLECVLFSLNLRRSGLLQKALQGGVRCLPPFWGATLQNMLQSSCLPSEAKLSRSRLFLDVSFMLRMKEFWRKLVVRPPGAAVRDSCSSGSTGVQEDDAGGVLYMLADSSPQRHQNWFMVEVFGVYAKQLDKCASCFEKLHALQFQESLGADVLEASLQWVEELRSCRFHHILPPTALGPRHATLSHKTHALLHALRLECDSWSHVQQLLDCVVTFTSDQGVEMNLNMAAASLEDLFPYWRLSVDMRADTGIVGCDRDADASAACARPADSQAHRGPDVIPEDPEIISLRKSLFAPGMFHIVDGITKDLLRESTVWSRVKTNFESALKFFHKSFCRIMFLQSCLALYPDLRGWQSLFSTGPPLFEGGRAWGVLQRGISWLLPSCGSGNMQSGGCACKVSCRVQRLWPSSCK